jgi:peptidoglycan L-alanyl-D-glutamate endopeptidase CwlK
MPYKLGNRSVQKLEGVDERMQAVVRAAIGQSKQDFSVICGLRTIEEQRALVAKGASQTMKSKHIDGLAVDLMAYVDGGRWELNLYDEIADAMAEGARACDVPIKWGAAWTVPNIAQWEGDMESAMNDYIDTRRSQGRRPFIDAPHFELVV